MTTPYHHGDLKSTLLAYALEQLEGAGLDGLSMREMAKAVGVSHTAAYRHFADKQALLDAMAEQGFEALRQAIRDAVATAQGSPDRLLASGLAYVQFGRQHPRQLAHMFGAATRATAPPGLRSVAADVFNDLQTLVAEGQQNGSFRAGAPRALAHACWAMVHGLALLQGGHLLSQSAGVDSRAGGDTQADTHAVPQLQDEHASPQARAALEILVRGLAPCPSPLAP
jgi:AcrR family transcriptional regulator